MSQRNCNKHGKHFPDEPAARPVAEFGKHSANPDGLRYECRRCVNLENAERRDRNRERNEAERAAAAAVRLASDTEALKPGDLGDDYTAPNYDREKKQEYNAQMGEFAASLREMQTDPEKMARFVSLTAEQERRWLNKRLARSQAIGAARELLFARQFELIAERVRWPVRAEGYAAKLKHSHARRTATLALSDLHFGAQLPGYENPVAFDFVTAGRRLARLAYECGEFKSQYRDTTHLNLGINGDIIEGLLGWNDADNAPLAEQLVAAGYFLVRAIEYLAARWISITVYMQPGNHGRNKLTHPGRATSSKWNAFETALYQFVARECVRVLPNVKFQIPKAPVVVIPLFDHNALMLHGDTELRLKAPSSSGGVKAWNDALNAANAPKSHEPESPPMYGAPVHVLISGHFHDPALFPLDRGWGLSQGALVPPNGHARTAGYASRCMFWIFESVPRYPVGDARPLRVGPRDDSDASLDDIVPPFAWQELIEAA